MSTSNFFSGTSGLVLPVKQALYPPEFQGKSRLTYYASLFNSIEINSSFYRNPKESTVQKWAESVPANFRFTFKLFKAITHAKGLEFKDEDVNQFIKIIDHIGDKKGCLLVQFPPSLKLEKLNHVFKLLKSIRKADPKNRWKIAIEFRNSSWYESEVYEVLNDYQANMVIQDLPASATPFDTPLPGTVYLRFHGPGGRYRGSYSDDFLLSYAEKINSWLKERKQVYCYFNNTMGDAIKNLQILNRLVKI